MKPKQILATVLVLLGLTLGHDALAYYNPQTGCWPNRDPLGELGFELAANRSGKKSKAQEKVHYQKGLSELLVANPAVAVHIRSQLSQLGIRPDTEVEPSAGNLYIFVQNEPVSTLDMSGLDIWYWYCIFSCPCRPAIGMATGWTLWPVSDTSSRRCCTATQNIFCGSAFGGGVMGYIAALEAADIYFQECLIMWRP